VDHRSGDEKVMETEEASQGSNGLQGQGRKRVKRDAKLMVHKAGRAGVSCGDSRKGRIEDVWLV
jgi:hypothetical protein